MNRIMRAINVTKLQKQGELGREKQRKKLQGRDKARLESDSDQNLKIKVQPLPRVSSVEFTSKNQKQNSIVVQISPRLKFDRESFDMTPEMRNTSIQ